MNIYEQHGFESRNAYLKDLADNNGVSLETVLALADLLSVFPETVLALADLGPNEDFDGLVTELKDFFVYFHGADQ